MKEDSLSILLLSQSQAAETLGLVGNLRKEYPAAQILVVDNSSTREAVAQLEAVGAEVVLEPRRGKAQAVISTLPFITGHLLILLDPAKIREPGVVASLVDAYHSTRADMIVGIPATRAGLRPEGLQDAAVSAALRLAFGQKLDAVYSGVRLLSKPFYKNVPILSRGLNLDLELAIQALDKGFRILEVEVPCETLVKAPPESSSGLRTLRLWLTVFRDYKPVFFFGSVALAFAAAGLLVGAVPIREYFETGIVRRMMLPILAASLMIIAFFTSQIGLVLEASLRARRETYQTQLRRAYDTASGGTDSPPRHG